MSRPELTNEDIGKAGAFSMALASLPYPKRVQLIYRICEENMRLLREVNQYRERDGLELLPVYDPAPQVSKNGKR